MSVIVCVFVDVDTCGDEEMVGANLGDAWFIGVAMQIVG